MEFRCFHDWDVSPSQAIQIQKEHAGRVKTEGNIGKIRSIAGVDAAFQGDIGIGAVAILRYPELTLIERVTVESPVMLPYIPGLLSFREIPILLRAFDKIQHQPDVIFVDGQGMLHPRRFGIACHLGLILDRPAIGCGKSLLCGHYETPGAQKGDYTFVYHNGSKIGIALRTRRNTKEIFVSIGHKITIEKALELTLSVSPKYRIPEPIRHADHLAAMYKKKGMVQN